jgi:crossover junction endodeoxyribonuclease RusA
VIVTLPWPDKRLSPNARLHWAALSTVKKKARGDACYAALEAAGSAMPAIRAALDGEGKIALRVRFYPPDNRHRDTDNMVAALKAPIDGIADALEVNDRRFLPHYFFEPAAKPGRVEVELV